MSVLDMYGDEEYILKRIEEVKREIAQLKKEYDMANDPEEREMLGATIADLEANLIDLRSDLQTIRVSRALEW